MSKTRSAVVGISPAMRRFYRQCREQHGFTRESAEVLTQGAVLFTGEGHLATLKIHEGATSDAKGRVDGRPTVGDLIRKVAP